MLYYQKMEYYSTNPLSLSFFSFSLSYLLSLFFVSVLLISTLSPAKFSVQLLIFFC